MRLILSHNIPRPLCSAPANVIEMSQNDSQFEQEEGELLEMETSKSTFQKIIKSHFSLYPSISRLFLLLSFTSTSRVGLC